MKIFARKASKEEVILGQADGVVVNGGGPVNTTNFRKDFEEAAAKLEKLIKIGDTTTGDGEQIKAEQLKIEPEGTPNPAKEDKKKEATEELATSNPDSFRSEVKRYLDEYADVMEALK